MDGQPVELPEDLADEYFLHTLSGGDLSQKEPAERMSVRDAILWRHMMRYSSYLEQEHMKKTAKENR